MLTDLHERIRQKYGTEIELSLPHIVRRGDLALIDLIIWNLILNPICALLLFESWQAVKSKWTSKHSGQKSLLNDQQIREIRRQLLSLNKNNALIDESRLKEECYRLFKTYGIPDALAHDITSEIVAYAGEWFKPSESHNDSDHTNV